jgi:peptidoglycan/LPS O-acetylase OafA/YrhL
MCKSRFDEQDEAVGNRGQTGVRDLNGHIIGLDVIRFCASLMVTFFHLTYWSWAPIDSLTKSISGGGVEFPTMAKFTWLGWVGVEIFFVISGFVISYSAAGVSPFVFLRRRIVRLYPSAWICATATLVTVLLISRGNADTASEYARAMTLWVQGPWIDGVYWTLGIEIIFYVLIFAMLCLGRFGSISVVLSIMTLLSTAFWGALAIDRVLPGMLPVGFLHDLLASPASAFLLLRHGCFFALGGLLWLCQSKRLTPWRTVLLGLCLLSGVLEIFDSARSIALPIGDSPERRMIACAVWIAAVTCLAAAIVYNQVLHKLFGKSAGVIKFLGLMTYPLYLLHDIIGAALLKAASLVGASPLVALVFAMTIVLALSWAVTQFLEPPIQVLLRILLSRSRQPAIQTG